MGGFPRGDGLLIATAHLPPAAVNKLFSAPTPIVPAPGDGYWLALVAASIEYATVATGFGNYSPAPTLFYGTPAAANVASSNPNGAEFALMGANIGPAPTTALLLPEWVQQVGTGPTTNAYLRSLVEDQPLVLGDLVQDADPTTRLVSVNPTPAAAGTGYAVNDTGTIDGSWPTGDAAYLITAVAPITGAVTAFTITSLGAGGGYSLADSPQTTSTGGAQPGAGTGFEVAITAVAAPDDHLYLTVRYQVLALH